MKPSDLVPGTFQFWRSLLLGLGLLVALAACASPMARTILLGQGPLLSLTLLSLAALILLPARIFALAPLLGGAGLILLRWVSAQKVAAIGLPLSYLDVVNVGSDPQAFLSAVGIRGAGMALPVLAAAVAVVSVGLIARVRRRLSPRKAGLRLAEVGVVLAVGLLSLNATAKDLRDKLPRIFPQIDAELWQPSGQQSLAQAVGPLEYIAFTRLLGDGEAANLRAAEAPPLPLSSIRAAALDVLGALPHPAQPPNIVLIHAEFHLRPERDLQAGRTRWTCRLWTVGPETRLLAPLRVNVVGGGSWVTEFEVLTGVDSRGFGYQGLLHPPDDRSGGAGRLPRLAGAGGDDTAAYYTEGAAWFGVGEAFRHYGVAAFHDAPSIGLAADWSDDDLAIVRKDLAAGVLAGGDRPFFAFVSTPSNHGPHPCLDDPDAADAAVRFAAATGPGQACALAEYVLRARVTRRRSKRSWPACARSSARRGAPGRCWSTATTSPGASPTAPTRSPGARRGIGRWRPSPPCAGETTPGSPSSTSCVRCRAPSPRRATPPSR